MPSAKRRYRVAIGLHAYALRNYAIRSFQPIQMIQEHIRVYGEISIVTGRE